MVVAIDGQEIDIYVLHQGISTSRRMTSLIEGIASVVI